MDYLLVRGRCSVFTSQSRFLSHKPRPSGLFPRFSASSPVTCRYFLPALPVPVLQRETFKRKGGEKTPLQSKPQMINLSRREHRQNFVEILLKVCLRAANKSVVGRRVLSLRSVPPPGPDAPVTRAVRQGAGLAPSMLASCQETP